VSPTDDEVIQATGDHPAYAIVLVTARVGGFAIALVDTNGDARCIDFHTLWRRNEHDSWMSGSSVGPEPSVIGTVQRGGSRAYEWAYGRAEPLESITIEVANRPRTATATADGWWAVLVGTT